MAVSPVEAAEESLKKEAPTREESERKVREAMRRYLKSKQPSYAPSPVEAAQESLKGEPYIPKPTPEPAPAPTPEPYIPAGVGTGIPPPTPPTYAPSPVEAAEESLKYEFEPMPPSPPPAPEPSPIPAGVGTGIPPPPTYAPSPVEAAYESLQTEPEPPPEERPPPPIAKGGAYYVPGVGYFSHPLSHLEEIAHAVPSGEAGILQFGDWYVVVPKIGEAKAYTAAEYEKFIGGMTWEQAIKMGFATEEEYGLAKLRARSAAGVRYRQQLREFEKQKAVYEKTWAEDPAKALDYALKHELITKEQYEYGKKQLATRTQLIDELGVDYYIPPKLIDELAVAYATPPIAIDETGTPYLVTRPAEEREYILSFTEYVAQHMDEFLKPIEEKPITGEMFKPSEGLVKGVLQAGLSLVATADIIALTGGRLTGQEWAYKVKPTKLTKQPGEVLLSPVFGPEGWEGVQIPFTDVKVLQGLRWPRIDEHVKEELETYREKIERYPGMLIGDIAMFYLEAKAVEYVGGKIWRGVKRVGGRVVPESAKMAWYSKVEVPVKVAYRTKIKGPIERAVLKSAPYQEVYRPAKETLVGWKQQVEALRWRLPERVQKVFWPKEHARRVLEAELGYEKALYPSYGVSPAEAGKKVTVQEMMAQAEKVPVKMPEKALQLTMKGGKLERELVTTGFIPTGEKTVWGYRPSVMFETTTQLKYGTPTRFFIPKPSGAKTWITFRGTPITPMKVTLQRAMEKGMFKELSKGGLSPLFELSIRPTAVMPASPLTFWGGLVDVAKVAGAGWVSAGFGAAATAGVQKFLAPPQPIEVSKPKTRLRPFVGRPPKLLTPPVSKVEPFELEHLKFRHIEITGPEVKKREKIVPVPFAGLGIQTAQAQAPMQMISQIQQQIQIQAPKLEAPQLTWPPTPTPTPQPPPIPPLFLKTPSARVRPRKGRKGGWWLRLHPVATPEEVAKRFLIGPTLNKPKPVKLRRAKGVRRRNGQKTPGSVVPLMNTILGMI